MNNQSASSSKRGRNGGRLDQLLYRIRKMAEHFSAMLEDPLRRLQLSLMSLVAFLAVGMVGYMFLEQMPLLNAFYMTIITVTTVGFGDIVPTSNASRLFTVFLIIAGIGTATTALSNAVELLVGERLWGAVRAKRIEEMLRMIENHYIVAGYGRIGKQIVRDIISRGEHCVVIDAEAPLHKDDFLIEENVPFIIGDATADEVLSQAGVMRARGFVAALPSDADNVLAILTARGFKEDLFIVARSTEVTSEGKLRRAGANQVISPYQVGGHRMAIALMRPAVHDFLNHLSDTSDAESFDIGQIDIHEGSRLAGQTMITCDLRRVRGLTVLSIVRQGKLIINPDVQLPFEVGDHLVVIGPPQSIYNLEALHRSEGEEPN